jgi:hypothetical protein
MIAMGRSRGGGIVACALLAITTWAGGCVGYDSTSSAPTGPDGGDATISAPTGPEGGDATTIDPVGVLATDPAVLDFGVVDVGTISSLTLKITNTGEVPIRAPAVALGPVVFSLTNSGCQADLGVGADCTLDVAFAPTVFGPVANGALTGIRIFQGMHPDVVMIQEFNYGNNSDTAIRQFVNTAFGPSFSYYREVGAQIPNGVISRWPIIAAGEWDDTQVDNRDFAWARIDVPGPKDLWVVSVHLLTSSASVRNTEAANLVSLINANVPAGDYLAIGGDFLRCISIRWR